jgi:hypothetical protein
MFVSHAVRAQDRAPEVTVLKTDISVEDLQKRYLEAMGGEAALSSLKSLISRGTVEIAGLDQPGKVEVYEKAPGRTLTRMVIAGSEMLEGCTETSAWEKDPDGVKSLQGDELRDAVRNCAFLDVQDLKRTYTSLKIAGKARQGDTEFYLVDALRSDGVNDVLTIDARTYLLTMVVTPRLIEGKRVPVPALLGDYRSVGGVKLPHLLRSRIGDVTMAIRLSTIEPNATIDDKMFEPPR